MYLHRSLTRGPHCGLCSPLRVCVHVAAATVQMAKHALSNLLGGITHFHGRPVVQMTPTSQPYEPEERSLVTGVPSRSFFPR